MAKLKRIYLAGPEVFFPATEHQAILAGKKRLLREYGFFSAELFHRCVRALARGHYDAGG